MLQFVREIPLRIILQGASSERRGFLFFLSAGFSKPVDPMTGMTVNLVKVDKWLLELKANLQQDVFISETENLSHAMAELMAVTRLNLLEKTEQEQATLVSLEFREERGWSFAWDHLMSAEEMRFKYHHYLETFFEEPSLGREFDLLKIEFCWRRARGCEIDFQNEGFKILKHLRQNKNSNQNLRDQLRSQIGLAWPSGSVLEDITVHQLGSEFSLQL